MRIIRYLGQCKVAAALVVLMLAIQALCDLALPTFTSNIVDVGIQQAGIEHASPDELTAASFDAMESMATPDDALTLRNSYSWDDTTSTYHLTEQGTASRDSLDATVGTLLAAVRLPEAQVSEALSAQAGVAAARAEYEALGRDLSGTQTGYLLRTGALMLAVTALGAAADAVANLLAARAGARVAHNLRERLFARVCELSEAEVQRFSAASLITRGTNDIQQIQTTIVLMLRMVIMSPILAAGGIFMVARTNPSLSWVIVLAVVLLFVLLGVMMAVAMPRFRVMQRLIDRVNLVAREMLTGLPVIRAFSRQRHEQERFDEASRDLLGTQLFTNHAMVLMQPAMMLIMNGTSVLIVWAGGHAIDAGAMQTGDMIAFLTYAMLIIMSFLMIGMVAVMLPRADVAAQRVNEVIDCVPGIADPASPRDAELGTSGGARLAFEDVSFSYPEEEAGGGDTPEEAEAGAPEASANANGSRHVPEAALSHVSLVVEPGTTLAVIGPTGSGKTTLCKLVERFYDVSEGRVTIDGMDVRDLSQHALRAQVGYVPQQAFLFSGTVGDNVAYADPAMGDARVEEALAVAQAADFVASRAEGLQAPVSQGGTNVSGGQRQRLAIARAVASDARLLLFDDSFSALDYKTDAALRHALRASRGERTVVIVAQRIATVMDADQILVLDDGRVAGLGTHEQLLAGCPAYREIARSQLSPEELARMEGHAAKAEARADRPESQKTRPESRAARAEARATEADGQSSKGGED